MYTKSTRFSKYKPVEESTYFILQKRKTPSVSKRGHRPTYRIITKGVPYYEVAYDFDLDKLRATVSSADFERNVKIVVFVQEWNYIINDLPQHLPIYLTPKSRLKWRAMTALLSYHIFGSGCWLTLPSWRSRQTALSRKWKVTMKRMKPAPVPRRLLLRSPCVAVCGSCVSSSSHVQGEAATNLTKSPVQKSKGDEKKEQAKSLVGPGASPQSQVPSASADRKSTRLNSSHT